MVGNVDAGKSTLLGVLTHGELDNGRGHARQKLFRHKHEMESGRTSSVGNDILGFDSEGHVVNKPEGHGKILCTLITVTSFHSGILVFNVSIISLCICCDHVLYVAVVSINMWYKHVH